MLNFFLWNMNYYYFYIFLCIWCYFSVSLGNIILIELKIVFTGIFVALALRFDVSRGKVKRYFVSSFIGYSVGLTLTIIVMNWFQAAQVCC